MIRLFRVSIPASTILLVLSDTVVLIACYVFAALFALNPESDPLFYIRYEDGWLQIALVASILQAGLYFMDVYEDPGLRTSRILLVQQLCMVLGLSFLVQALLGYGKVSRLQLPQWTMLYGSVLVLVLIPIWRVSFWEIVRRALPSKKLLFLGDSPSIQEIITNIVERPNMGLTVLGYVSDAQTLTSASNLGSPNELAHIIRVGRPDSVIIDEIAHGGQLSTEQRLGLKRARVHVDDSQNLYEVVLGRVSVRDLEANSGLSTASFEPSPWKVRAQNVYSFVLGLIGTILTLPIMLVVVLVVKLSSPGPAVYRQKRVGLYGKPFFLYKFRSMYIDAEARTGPVWASKNDPRITPVGRWLRLLRLDELPQFFNVLRGEMAVVGPRPERPEFCEILQKQNPYFAQRHLVRPGITGWAQINHQYTESIEGSLTKLEYDLYYVKHLAPALDAYIIFHTLKVMVLFRGAQ